MENYVYTRLQLLTPQAAMKFFDPAIFQKCWWGQGAKPLVAAAALDLRQPDAQRKWHRQTRPKDGEPAGLSWTSLPCNLFADGRECILVLQILIFIPGECSR
ncbi:hypothetical protein [uncultured Ruminococcus sp.]|uniref:hypothetical protein n=1 Tax=uncultured Ruminococcus sp. TaxID=165186 RepID=UPI002628E4DD|nr:hypothetical protein [uncultured Ruminococcus sp.]